MRSYHEFDKWEHELDAWRNAEDRATLDADIVKLYRALENNTVVRRVDVSGSFGTISSRGATAIAQALSGNRSISDVTICWDGHIFTGPNTMKTVLGGLVGNHNIKKLTISGNAGHDGSQSPSTLGGSLSRILGKVLQDSSIEELVLVDKGIDWEQGLSPICEGLRKSESIKKLSLVDPYFSLDEMHASKNVLHSDVCDELCDAIGDIAKVHMKVKMSQGLNSLIRKHRNIEELRVVVTDSSDYSEWYDLAKALSQNDTIRTVVLCNGNDGRFGPPGHATIDQRSRPVFESIASGNVEKLITMRMRVDDEGIGIICKALQQSTSIVELNLYSCGVDRDPILGWSSQGGTSITVKGAKRIAGLLRSSQSLEAVIIDSLWGTHKFDVGDEGAVAIAEAVAMRRAKTTQLVLKNCNISDTGGIALCRLLEIVF